MKKAIYLLAATAFLSSCNQEVLIDTRCGASTAPRAIAFETFADKATRADANNSTALNDFYSTFNVYGWKTVGDVAICVFDNIPVEYFAEDKQGTVVYKEADQKPTIEWSTFTAGWYYQNIRYWDKMASKYQYSAYAPASATDEVSCTSDGLITIGTDIAPVTVDGKNLMATPATDLAYKGFDRDYMTAQATAEPSTNAAAMSAPVSLNFKHLQAKLNIRTKLDASITTAQDVSIQKIQVHNLGDKGYYTNEANVTGTVSGWKLGTATATYIPKVETNYSLNAATNYDNHYLLEQLIIPQTINKSTATIPSLDEYTEACVYVEYTIGTEVFKSFTPLANIFTTADTYDFEGGKQYTLNITIGPKPIEFTAEVTEWAEATTKDLLMD